MAEPAHEAAEGQRARQLAWLADLQEELRFLLNAWDPLGVADTEVAGEYDCLVAPLLLALAAGDSRAGFSELVWREVEHLGVDPWGRGCDAFADRLLAWYAAKADLSDEVGSSPPRARRRGRAPARALSRQERRVLGSVERGGASCG